VTPQEYLLEKFPPLRDYCPIVESFSAQQIAFLLDPSREVLYGGAVGGGKSAALLAAVLRYVHIPRYSALILRRTYAELEKSGGLVPLADEWLSKTDARRSDGGKKWKFPSGARIEFGHVQHEHDKTKYQGAAYTTVGFDELTHFTETVYDYIGFSRQRRDFSVKAPIQTLATANPGGVGHLWVKERFQLSAKARKGLPRFFPAKVHDNPAWREGEYEASLAFLPDELRRQLLEGDWDAFADQAFPNFGPHNLIPSFSLRDSHDRFECADYGFNGTAWYLVVNDYDGNIIFFDSLYEKDLLPSQVAKLVLEKRKLWGPRNRVEMDPSIWKRTGGLNAWGQPATLATEFSEGGVELTPANRDPRAGYTRLREIIEARPDRKFPSWHPHRGESGAPQLYIVEPTCGELAEQLQSAPLQPIDKADGGEKIDPGWEGDYGHSVAAARYGVMGWASRNPSKVPVDTSPVGQEEWARDRRRELLAKHHKKTAEGQSRPGRFIQV
jgi:hypothetical protein